MTSPKPRCFAQAGNTRIIEDFAVVTPIKWKVGLVTAVEVFIDELYATVALNRVKRAKERSEEDCS